MVYGLIVFFIVGVIFALFYGELFLKLFSIAWEKIRSLHRSGQGIGD